MFTQKIITNKAIPSNNKKFTLVSLWTHAPPEIHGEDGARTVKNRGQRTHDGGQHHGHQ